MRIVERLSRLAVEPQRQEGSPLTSRLRRAEEVLDILACILWMGTRGGCPAGYVPRAPWTPYGW